MRGLSLARVRPPADEATQPRRRRRQGDQLNARRGGFGTVGHFEAARVGSGGEGVQRPRKRRVLRSAAASLAVYRRVGAVQG